MNLKARRKALAEFISAATTAYLSRASDLNSTKSLNQFFAGLDETSIDTQVASGRIPACRHMQEVIINSRFIDHDLQLLMRKFVVIEPLLKWRIRSGSNSGASDNFADNHANAMIIGPGGLENRGAVQLGVTLLGANVRYPDHRHSPEETYLVISTGYFRNEDQKWMKVSQGGTFYNPGNITHAMRSSDIPLFVFWALSN